jgi:predicted MPP superfamily phosphohydrolase
MEFANSFAKESGYKILLSHHPEYYGKYLKDLDINLILSGHAHGGQWRLFGRGVFAPGQGLFPKYTSGMYDNKLIVSRGIGNQMLVPRINNSKEIIVLNFKGEEK